MGNRRLARVPTSDDEDEAPPTRDETKRRKRLRLSDEEEEDQKQTAPAEAKSNKDDSNDNSNNSQNENGEDDGDGESGKDKEEDADLAEEAEDDPEAVPLGDVVRVSGKGKGKRNHYTSFEYDGNQYQLEDPVLLVPEETNQKPYVAIIKDISQTCDGSMMVMGQWFYRPEEAEKRGGGNWESNDTRELFYSFHRDEVPAESVMHKCVVHFIPLNKQIPKRKQHPGFIVQKVYDTDEMRLFKLTDKDYEDIKQHEIDLLVQKTIARIGDLPDVEPEDSHVDNEEATKNKRLLRKRSVSALDVSRDDDGPRPPQSLQVETPGSTPSSNSEYYSILSNSKQLTDDTQRNKWLEKLLQSIHFVCTAEGNKTNDEEDKRGSHVKSPTNKNAGVSRADESESLKLSNVDDASINWPDAAVSAVVALEKAAHDSLSSELKYNQKMRQLAFNLKSNPVLARRLRKGELEPAQILSMSPNELKEGLTVEEIASKQPEESGEIQMTDARCRRCTEKQVRLIDIIQTGHSDRYQLECLACGNIWYASRDDAATLTIEGPSSAKAVGTVPLATAKFEDVEKSLLSPRGGGGGDNQKGSSDVLKKTTEAFVPVLENQRSFNKSKTTDENPTTTN